MSTAAAVLSAPLLGISDGRPEEPANADPTEAAAAPSKLSPAEANERIKNSYSKLAKVGEGTYASVFLAQHIPSGRKAAIKKIKVLSSKDGLDVTAIREVKFLKELQHPNVIQVRAWAAASGCKHG